MGASTAPTSPPPPLDGAPAGSSSFAGPAPYQRQPQGYPQPPRAESYQAPSPPPPSPFAAPGFAPPPPHAGYTAAPPGYVPPPAGMPHAAPMPPPPPGAPAIALYPAPVAGVALRPPLVPPQPGQVLLGYQLVQPEVGICQCEGLSAAGVLAVILLVFIFWPLAWIPCVMPECYEQVQRPVYGWPAPGMQGPAGHFPPS